MLESQYELNKLFSTVIKLFQEQGANDISKVLKAAVISSEVGHYDNWNGGTEYYSIYIDVDATLFSFYEDQLSIIEEKIKEKLEILLRGVESEKIGAIIIRPVVKQYIDWTSVSDRTAKVDFLEKLNRIKSILISVATGGPKIQTVNEEYKNLYKELYSIFETLQLNNPNRYKDLWEWYGYWSSGDLPSYQSRRKYISDLYIDVIDQIEKSSDTVPIDQPFEITGWERVDRGVSEIRKRMSEAQTEEQFQAVGLLSREVFISLAQEVYDSEIHISTDGVNASKTDAKRMLDAFLSYELVGPSNVAYRRYAKSALDLANDLTHRRSASIHEASICVIAVISLVNIVKVITNKSNIRF
ncbi:hypothetical protein [Lysinibacillus sp. Y5S-8]|uniref:hypothetical protein n=1 Tax=Lysinibacillus sp. Y5S-8 TaxID=3122488 RepID=UPI0030CEEA59